MRAAGSACIDEERVGAFGRRACVPDQAVRSRVVAARELAVDVESNAIDGFVRAGAEIEQAVDRTA